MKHLLSWVLHRFQQYQQFFLNHFYLVHIFALFLPTNVSLPSSSLDSSRFHFRLLLQHHPCSPFLFLPWYLVCPVLQSFTVFFPKDSNHHSLIDNIKNIKYLHKLKFRQLLLFIQLSQIRIYTIQESASATLHPLHRAPFTIKKKFINFFKKLMNF